MIAGGRSMKIYHYDDKYAGKNGVNGVKELILALCIGIPGIIAPVILLALNIITWRLGLAIIILTIAAVSALLHRMSIIVTASRSAIIDDGDRLYYLTVTPNLRGSSMPSSFSAMMAGSSATYAENSLNAGISATNFARSDEFVLQLFKLYRDDQMKTTFDTVMYGKPATVYELLDRDFGREDKKIYRVKCVKNRKRNTTVRIPRVFPEFFE
jgi:hypothetical protein